MILTTVNAVIKAGLLSHYREGGSKVELLPSPSLSVPKRLLSTSASSPREERVPKTFVPQEHPARGNCSTVSKTLLFCLFILYTIAVCWTNEFHPYHALFVESRKLNDRWNQPQIDKVNALLNEVEDAILDIPDDLDLKLLKVKLLFQKRELIRAREELDKIDIMNPKMNHSQMRRFLMMRAHLYWAQGDIRSSLSCLFDIDPLWYIRMFPQLWATIFLSVLLLVLYKSLGTGSLKVIGISGILMGTLPILYTFAGEIFFAGAPFPVHSGDRALSSLFGWGLHMFTMLLIGLWIRKNTTVFGDSVVVKANPKLIIFAVVLFCVLMIFLIFNLKNVKATFIVYAIDYSSRIFWLYCAFSIFVGTISFYVLFIYVYNGLRLSMPVYFAILLSILYYCCVWFPYGLDIGKLPLYVGILVFGATLLLYEGSRKWWLAIFPLFITRVYVHILDLVWTLGQL